ncbi:MAG: hypothetical protein J5846_03850 [Desulfovibrio sp.]|nr:hypothetical protein [Desulfovibrio sp.]
MSVDATIAVLYAQTGLGTQFAHAAAVAPHAQASMSRVLALETAKQEQHLIEKSNQAEKKGIENDEQKKGRAPLFGSRRRQRGKSAQKENDTPTSPYSGNFLNLTV